MLPNLRPVQIRGSHWAVGEALGKLAAPLMSDYLAQSGVWQALKQWRQKPFLYQLAKVAKTAFPWVWTELEGMAHALDMDVMDLFLWNCRGDLLYTNTDGCTSILHQSNDGSICWIGHNEDGDPFLHGRCFLVEVTLTDETHDKFSGFISFYYPGSLVGHTFAVNIFGVVQTINNLRTVQRRLGVPRMFLARALLMSRTVRDAVALLQSNKTAGGFHYLLASAAFTGFELYSVEATSSCCSVQQLKDDKLRLKTMTYAHSNHILHSGHADLARDIVTDSSLCRYQNVGSRIKTWPEDAGGQQVVDALFDTHGPLPVLRTDPDDPDDENTLATALFEIAYRDGSFVKLKIFDRQSCLRPIQVLNCIQAPV